VRARRGGERIEGGAVRKRRERGWKGERKYLTLLGVVRVFSSDGAVTERYRHKSKEEIKNLFEIPTMEAMGKREAVAERVDARSSKHPRVDLVPVTLLSGFLGAGKTSTLKHILETNHKAEGKFRCAVIVNDMAELNIDKELIEKVVQTEKVIAMSNGCVCCTLQDDLVKQMVELAQSGKFDYLLIEASGVSEPAQIARLFENCSEDHDHDFAHENKVPLNMVAKLDTIVTVVDSATFFGNLGTVKKSESKEPLAQLLVEQIATANVIVLNKTDLVSREQLERVSERVNVLNTKADVIPAQNGRVHVTKLLGTSKFNQKDLPVTTFDLMEVEPERACCSASTAQGKPKCCSKKPNLIDSGLSNVFLGKATKTRHAARFGVSSFVYQARRPFNPTRFHNKFVCKYFVLVERDLEELDNDEAEMEVEDATFVEIQQAKDKEEGDKVARLQEEGKTKHDLRTETLGDLCRSKGFIWMASSHDLMGCFQQAGPTVTIESPGVWAVLERKAYEGTDEEKVQLRKDWVAPWGDRRQDLVFIGIKLDCEKIQQILDECLLTDEELALGVDGWKATMGDIFLNEDDESDSEAEKEA